MNKRKLHKAIELMGECIAALSIFFMGYLGLWAAHLFG